MARKQATVTVKVATPAAVLAAPVALAPVAPVTKAAYTGAPLLLSSVPRPALLLPPGMARPAPAPVVAPVAPAPKVGRTTATYMAQQAAAALGTLPPVPDFSAPTHNSYRKLGMATVAAAQAGNVAYLRHVLATVQAKSSTRIMVVRYATMALAALTAQGKA